METKKVKLLNGIEIEDNRSLSLGISIKNGNHKFFKLGYSAKKGFYITTLGVDLEESEYKNYFDELQDMAFAVTEANFLINNTDLKFWKTK